MPDQKMYESLIKWLKILELVGPHGKENIFMTHFGIIQLRFHFLIRLGA